MGIALAATSGLAVASVFGLSTTGSLDGAALGPFVSGAFLASTFLGATVASGSGAVTMRNSTSVPLVSSPSFVVTALRDDAATVTLILFSSMAKSAASPDCPNSFESDSTTELSSPFL